jgi:aryl-alcohol dehydrogenase-like predicted oxidoreductase
VLKANWISDRMNLERFACGQYPYNLLDRTFEHELLPAFEDQGMGFNCWSPLAGGLLTGKYRGSTRPKKGTRIYKRINIDGSRFWSDRTLSVTEEILKIADDCGLNPLQLALSWLLHDRRVSAVIFGVTSLPQLEDILVSGDLAGGGDLAQGQGGIRARTGRPRQTGSDGQENDLWRGGVLRQAAPGSAQTRGAAFCPVISNNPS